MACSSLAGWLHTLNDVSKIIRNALRRHGIPCLLFDLLQSLQFVDDATLVFESSGVIASMVDAEGGTLYVQTVRRSD